MPEREGDAAGGHASPGPAPRGGSPLRVAYFTPLNPQRSGISDHSEELLPHLARRMAVDVVTGTPAPSSPGIRDRFTIIGPGRFLAERDRYDLAVYQLGNHLRFHRFMIPCMREVPGLVLVQDFCMQYVVLALTLGRGDVAAVTRILEPRLGAGEARRVAWRILLGIEDPGRHRFVGPFLRTARAVGVHSDYARRLVEEMAPGVPVATLPLGVASEPASGPRDELRRRLGLPATDFVVATVSTRAPKKRLDVVLRAIARLRSEVPGLRLLVVGGGTPGREVYSLIGALGLAQRVAQTGWLEPAAYRDAIRASDVVVDLRETGAGETAHSVLRSLSLGTPALVARRGAFLDLPDDCCPKVDVDRDAAGALAAILRELCRDPGRLGAMRAAAERFATRRLGLDVQAEAMAALARSVVETGPAPGPSDLLRSRGVPRPDLAALYRLSRSVRLARAYGPRDALRRLRLGLARRLAVRRDELV